MRLSDAFSTGSSLMPQKRNPDGAELARARRAIEPVDTATLETLRSQIGDDNLKTVLGKFQDEARKRWTSLTGAGDHETRAREAHTLASTCSSFGLPPAAEALRGIEERAKQETPEDASQLAEVGALLEQSLNALEDTVARL